MPTFGAPGAGLHVHDMSPASAFGLSDQSPFVDPFVVFVGKIQLLRIEGDRREMGWGARIEDRGNQGYKFPLRRIRIFITPAPLVWNSKASRSDLEGPWLRAVHKFNISPADRQELEVERERDMASAC
jgi:hypothetical protein